MSGGATRAGPAANDTPVLIVGAGPVGLISALLLAQQGVASVLLDRYPQRLGAPKAHAINPRTLEICRALGIPRETFVARATRAEDSLVVRFMTRLGEAEIGSLPYERQDDAVREFTPTPLLNIAQPAFEDILLDRIAREPRIQVRRGMRWLEARQDDSGVVSRVEDTATGERHDIASRWVIGSDGAESAVRRFLGIDMVGPQNLNHRLMIHFKADLRHLLGHCPGAIYWNMDPAAPGGFIAFDIDSNWVYMYRYDVAAFDSTTFSVDQCEAFVRGAIVGDAGPIEILHRSPWTLSVQLADRYRDGRIFLAGDAAHRFPPSGGLGLNTGVQDAHNLAWKLAAVEHRRAPATLLASFEAERRPIADVNARQSHLNSRNMVPVFDYIRAVAERPGGLLANLDDRPMRAELKALIDAQLPHFDSLGLQLGFSYGPDRAWVDHVSDYRPSVDVGARLPHAWVSAHGQTVSTLDLLDPLRFTLVTGRDAGAWGPEADALGIARVSEGEHFDDADGHWARAASLRPRGAVLVRPDGHVALAVADDSIAAREAVRGALRDALAGVLPGTTSAA